MNRTITAPRGHVRDYTGLVGRYDALRYVAPVDRMRESFRRQAFERLLPDVATRALDVACGTGRGMLALHARAQIVVGADITMEMLDAARKKLAGAGVSYCRSDAASLPFADRTFDVVTCLNFLHLFPGLPEKSAFVSEIARVVRPGGVAVVEFDNALQGLVLGPWRKYLGKDIGYDWPWTVRSCFPPRLFSHVTWLGANVPFVWRVPWLRHLEQAAGVFPFKYIANRIFVGAIRSEVRLGADAHTA